MASSSRMHKKVAIILLYISQSRILRNVYDRMSRQRVKLLDNSLLTVLGILNFTNRFFLTNQVCILNKRKLGLFYE